MVFTGKMGMFHGYVSLFTGGCDLWKFHVFSHNIQLSRLSVGIHPSPCHLGIESWEGKAIRANGCKWFLQNEFPKNSWMVYSGSWPLKLHRIQIVLIWFHHSKCQSFGIHRTPSIHLSPGDSFSPLFGCQSLGHWPRRVQPHILEAAATWSWCFQCTCGVWKDRDQRKKKPLHVPKGTEFASYVTHVLWIMTILILTMRL